MSHVRAIDDDDQVPDSNVSVLPHASTDNAATQHRPGAGVEVFGYDPDDVDIIDLPGSSVGRLHLLRLLDI
jgi:hypothetical protein